jgi:hypothetical protein
MAREMASQVVYSVVNVYVLQENMPIPFCAYVSSLHSQKPEHEMSAPLLSSSLLTKLYQAGELYTSIKAFIHFRTMYQSHSKA